MNEEEFNKLIKKSKYQVFIFSCPASVPINFASHLWFVLNKRGKISRWEVLFRKNAKKSWGHLHKNYFLPHQGLEVFIIYKGFLWKSKLVGFIEGDKNSQTHKIVKYIENSKKNYPYKNKYFLIRTNSNTYVKMVLKKFSVSEIRLPWNSFGREY